MEPNYNRLEKKARSYWTDNEQREITKISYNLGIISGAEALWQYVAIIFGITTPKMKKYLSDKEKVNTINNYSKN
jgi:hypothetical protein